MCGSNRVQSTSLSALYVAKKGGTLACCGKCGYRAEFPVYSALRSVYVLAFQCAVKPLAAR